MNSSVILDSVIKQISRSTVNVFRSSLCECCSVTTTTKLLANCPDSDGWKATVDQQNLGDLCTIPQLNIKFILRLCLVLTRIWSMRCSLLRLGTSWLRWCLIVAEGRNLQSSTLAETLHYGWWSVQPSLYGERSDFRFSHWLWLSCRSVIFHSCSARAKRTLL